jgi:hypothetical protein
MMDQMLIRLKDHAFVLPVVLLVQVHPSLGSDHVISAQEILKGSPFQTRVSVLYPISIDSDFSIQRRPDPNEVPDPVFS